MQEANFLHLGADIYISPFPLLSVSLSFSLLLFFLFYRVIRFLLFIRRTFDSDCFVSEQLTNALQCVVQAAHEIDIIK